MLGSICRKIPIVDETGANPQNLLQPLHHAGAELVADENVGGGVVLGCSGFLRGSSSRGAVRIEVQGQMAGPLKIP